MGVFEAYAHRKSPEIQTFQKWNILKVSKVNVGNNDEEYLYEFALIKFHENGMVLTFQNIDQKKQDSKSLKGCAVLIYSLYNFIKRI